jgi:ubiquinone/menaquinone biosynthesis C-methylase UbiE
MVQQTELATELARLEAEYSRRASCDCYTELYSYFNEATLYSMHSLERNLLALLKRHEFTSLSEKKILDVGCGSGGFLRRFLDYRASPGNLYGIDLMAQRIEDARRLHPGINWCVGSAHKLPYADASFDLVMSFVMFSSILDESLRQKIVAEMWRVLKPGGLILFYDFMYAHPHNQAVAGISQHNAKQLFSKPGVRYDFRRITLAPPISRIMAPRSCWLANTLELCKIFNTHLIAIIDLGKSIE